MGEWEAIGARRPSWGLLLDGKQRRPYRLPVRHDSAASAIVGNTCR